MAKKATTVKTVVRPKETVDERDTRTASEKRKAREREEAANKSKPAEEDDPNVEKNPLPLNHATLRQTTDTGLPPEATPREGKTSPAPPVSINASETAQARQRRIRAEMGQDAGEIEELENPEDRSMLVQATRMGYYDNARRRPGDVFSIHPEQFSDRWMQKAPRGAAATRPTTANKAIAQENDATAAMRRGATAAGQLPATNVGSTVPKDRSDDPGLDD